MPIVCALVILSHLPIPIQPEHDKILGSLPRLFDWRNVSNVDYVSPVRDQKDCGACYAFSATATMESRIRIMTNNENQVILSPQQIVSCSNYSQGCGGGFPYLVSGNALFRLKRDERQVFKYGEDFGLYDDACLPYNATNPPMCRQQCHNPVRYHTTNYGYVGGCVVSSMSLLDLLPHTVRSGITATAPRPA